MKYCLVPVHERLTHRIESAKNGTKFRDVRNFVLPSSSLPLVLGYKGWQKDSWYSQDVPKSSCILARAVTPGTLDCLLAVGLGYLPFRLRLGNACLGRSLRTSQAGTWSLAPSSPRTRLSMPASTRRLRKSVLSRRWSIRNPASRSQRFRS